jgi:hypothetical protein
VVVRLFGFQLSLWDKVISRFWSQISFSSNGNWLVISSCLMFPFSSFLSNIRVRLYSLLLNSNAFSVQAESSPLFLVILSHWKAGISGL